MAGLLYYLPGKSEHVVLADLAAAGLGYAFERELIARGVQRGPEGQGVGVVVADPRLTESKLGYWPEKQSWRKVPGLEAWVGFYPDDRPQPVELLRRQVVPGHEVELADGRHWLIPVARAAVEEQDEIVGYQSALPETTAIDDNGHWVRGGLLPRYDELWALALRWWDALTKAGADQSAEAAETNRVEFDFAGVMDGALIALAANYRIGKADVALLGLFDEQRAIAILNALVDWPTFKRWVQKKTAAAG